MRLRPEHYHAYIIAGVGALLGLVLFIEIVWYVLRLESTYGGFVLGAVTSGPFVLGMVYAGYWLSERGFSPEQCDRISRWWGSSMIVTMLLITGINTQVQPLSAAMLAGTVRWSAAIGGGIGLVIGVIRTQTILQKKEAERVRRQKQQIEREREQLDEFANILSHDLKNPLQTAQGHLELLSEESDSPHIDSIASAHDRMAALIEDTLRLARTEREIDELEPVAVAAVVESAWGMIDSSDATLRVEETRTIYADENWLQTLFENLFTNAITHGGEDVTVSVGTVENGFYVADTGPGIPEADREAVFEPGYSTGEDGTGFGLRIVAKIIDAHDWQITVTESKQGGARFEITDVTFAAE